MKRFTIILILLVVTCFLFSGCNKETVSGEKADYPTLPDVIELENPLPPVEEPTEENEREGEEILINTASIDKANLLSDLYTKYVGVTIGELKTAFPDIMYVGFKSEAPDYTCDAYAVSENEKVFYLTQGQQSMYYGIPNEFTSDFSRIRDLHIWGIYGEIGTLFPEVNRNISVNVFEDFLGVEIEKIWEDANIYVFEYEGYQCWFRTEEGSIIISPETSIEMSFDYYSELYPNERKITDVLWLEVDPEGAAAFYEREKINEQEKTN